MVPLALLALVVAAAAASGSGLGAASGTAPTTSSPVAAGELTSAVAGTAGASSAAFTLSATSVANGVTTPVATGSGSFDLSKGVGHATMTIPVLASVPGVGTDDSVGVIADGAALYLDIPALSLVAGGKTWFSTAIPSAAWKALGAGSLSPTVLGDPTRLLVLLTKLGGTVVKVGTPSLGGMATTEYQTALDLSQIANQAQKKAPTSHRASGGKAPSGTSRSIGGALEQLGLSTIPAKVWVGSDGLVRQVQLTLDLAHVNLADPASVLRGLAGGPSTGSTTVPPAGSASAVTVTLGLSDFGVPVSVTPPPASQVADLQRTLVSLKGGLSSISSPRVSHSRSQAG